MKTLLHVARNTSMSKAEFLKALTNSAQDTTSSTNRITPQSLGPKPYTPIDFPPFKDSKYCLIRRFSF